MQPVGLTWVLADGRPTHVSRFATLRRGRRPPVTCPECGRRLTLKLGRVLRHHAAHAPLDRCVATRPETALHVDLKFHIASQLEAAIGSETALVIHRRCPGVRSEPCHTTHEHEWAHGWDEVLVETTLTAAGARPDILLRRCGETIGAIEVRVSHAIGDDKAAALRTAGVPWIEVRGDVALLEGDTTWSVDRPLGVDRAAGESLTWRCPRHEQAHHLWAEAGRRTSVLRGARVVDVYHSGGARDRVIYRVEEQLLDGCVHALVLRCGTREIGTEPADDSIDSKRAAFVVLRDAYAADVDRLTERSGGFADSPMRWASRDAAENLVHEVAIRPHTRRLNAARHALPAALVLRPRARSVVSAR